MESRLSIQIRISIILQYIVSSWGLTTNLVHDSARVLLRIHAAGLRVWGRWVRLHLGCRGVVRRGLHAERRSNYSRSRWQPGSWHSAVSVEWNRMSLRMVSMSRADVNLKEGWLTCLRRVEY